MGEETDISIELATDIYVERLQATVLASFLRGLMASTPILQPACRQSLDV
jgi:hypothetical protein